MADPDGSKTCRDCGEKKLLALFDKNSRNKGGYCGQCKACRVLYYRANADRYKAHAKRWREADPERAKRKDREQRQKGRERQLVTGKAYRDANRERRSEYNREYVRRNLDYFRAKNAVRRVRIGQSTSHHTPEDVQDLLRLQRGRCAVCRTKLDTYEVDHVKPLSKGGDNGRENIQLLCMHCNRSKHDKDPIEFMQSLGLLL